MHPDAFRWFFMKTFIRREQKEARVLFLPGGARIKTQILCHLARHPCENMHMHAPTL